MNQTFNAHVKRTFPANRSVLKEIREFIRRCAENDHFEAEADNLVIAVSEACANVILHSDSTAIVITWAMLVDRVEVDVQDDGVFRRRVPAPELDGKAHRGIPLMMALLDQVSISGGTEGRPGTLVRLVKYRPA